MALGKARARCIKAIYLTYVGCSFAIELCTFLGGLGCKFAPIRSLGITVCKNTTDVRKEARRTCCRAVAVESWKKGVGFLFTRCLCARAMAPIWKVVGGELSGGIVVRAGVAQMQFKSFKSLLGGIPWETSYEHDRCGKQVGIGQHGSRYNAAYLRSSSHLRSSKNVWQQACDKNPHASFSNKNGRDPAKPNFIQPFFGQIDSTTASL